MQAVQLIVSGDGLGIVLLQVGDQLPLRIVEDGMRCSSIDLALPHLVMGGEPVPDGYVQRGRRGIAKVAAAVHVRHSELG